MAIINATPDSFFEGSRSESVEKIVERATLAINQGADILDIGGYSTRPGADEISTEEEIHRVVNAVEAIRHQFPTISLSIDTFRSEVVQRLFDDGHRFIVNDISAGELDPRIIPLVGKLDLPYIAMHSRGTPQTMQSMTDYRDVCSEVEQYFETKIRECRQAGINRIIIDPGFGFAKTTAQNFELLRSMNKLLRFELPILAGLSRKSMIWRTLNITPNEALNGTTALNWEALRQGASILRVHDVGQAVEVRKLYKNFTT